MSQKIQVRRGTDAARKAVTFDLGEPVWATDTKKFYMGDGASVGGIPLGGGAGVNLNSESFTAIIPDSGSSISYNGSGLLTAVTNSRFKTPYGSGRSETNRYTILLYPGKYLCSSTTLSFFEYVDLIGVGDKKDIKLDFVNTAFGLYSGNNTFKNLSISSDMDAVFFIINDNLQKSGLLFENILYSSLKSLITDFQGITNSQFLNIENIPSQINGRGIFSATDADAWPSGCLISNCKIYGNSFSWSNLYSTFQKNVFKNCEFLSSSASATPMFYRDFNLTITDEEKTNIFINCYFSGKDMFKDDGASHSCKAVFESCQFDSNIHSFQGTMNNCVINNKYTDVPTVTITQNAAISNTYPQFSNCLIIGTNSQPGVTGAVGATNMTGLFMHCKSNRPIYSGVTGTMGNNFNIVDSKIKLYPQFNNSFSQRV